MKNVHSCRLSLFKPQVKRPWWTIPGDVKTRGLGSGRLCGHSFCVNYFHYKGWHI